jgi:hypothetical protein
MARPSSIILAVLLSIIFVSCNGEARPQPKTDVCTIPANEAIRIPTTVLKTVDMGGASRASASTLIISQGATDEPPDGPQGFDVLEDGKLLVTDPLRRQISEFDARGNFKKAWEVGFAADSVTLTPEELVIVREAKTGQLHPFDRDGKPRATERAVLPEVEGSLVMPGESRATVTRAGTQAPSPLSVQLDKPGFTLLSVESLGTDKSGNTFVALETTSNGTTDTISLEKFVRRYSADGKAVAETASIPLDYLVAPVDELRVHRGVVYQLQTTNSEVRINLWDTNSSCSHP